MVETHGGLPGDPILGDPGNNRETQGGHPRCIPHGDLPVWSKIKVLHFLT